MSKNDINNNGWEVIDSYSRKQAIQDGVLVDVSEVNDGEFASLVKEAGIKIHLAMTDGAWCATVQDPTEPLPSGQDAKGRLWDVLMVLRHAIRKAPMGEDRVFFDVRVWNGKKHDIVKLWCLVGPGDSGEPVMTVMLEGED